MKQLIVAIAVLGGGCVMDRQAADRPAHFQVGINTRQLAPHASAPSDPNIALRSTQPTEPAGADDSRITSTTGTVQFTMATRYHTYLGAEAESGYLGKSGSNFAGAYGILGVEQSGRYGSIAAEVAAGVRDLRYGFASPDVTSGVIEPRVRAQLWLSDQFALGAALGTDLGDHAWMAGLSLGVYSNAFNVWK
jgi:hypothetical protein